MCHIKVVLHRDSSVVEFVGELVEKDKMRGSGEHLIIFTRNSINSINTSNHVRQYLSYDYKSSLFKFS